jgi:hypothetical protein
MSGYEDFTDEMFFAAVELVALDARKAWDEYLAAGGEDAPLPVKRHTFARIASFMAELHALEQEVRTRCGLPLRPD